MQKFVNILGKTFVGIFLAILIFGLVFWGIGDVLKGRSNSKIAQVGNVEISSEEVNFLVANQKRQFALRGMNEIPPQMEEYLKQSALRQIINTKLFENELKNLGVEFDGTTLIKQDIADDENFDPAILKSQIASAGGEEAFINDYVQNKKLDSLESSITSNSPMLESYATTLYNLQNQVRDITLIEINKDYLGEIKQPNDADISKFYEENKEAFKTEETRDITYILIDKNSLKNIDEDSAVDDELYKLANDLLDKLAEGLTLEETAKDLNLKTSKLTNITSSQENIVGIENVTQTAFALGENESSELLESKDGKKYLILQVDAINPPQVKKLELVKADVINAINQDFIQQELVKKAQELQVNLTDKKLPLAEIKNKNGVEVKMVSNLKRDSKEFSPVFITEIFDAKTADYTKAFANQDKILIAYINEIKTPKNSDEIEMLDYRASLQEQISQELMAEYLKHLSTKYSIKTQ